MAPGPRVTNWVLAIVGWWWRPRLLAQFSNTCSNVGVQRWSKCQKITPTMSDSNFGPCLGNWSDNLGLRCRRLSIGKVVPVLCRPQPKSESDAGVVSLLVDVGLQRRGNVSIMLESDVRVVPVQCWTLPAVRLRHFCYPSENVQNLSRFSDSKCNWLSVGPTIDK